MLLDAVRTLWPIVATLSAMGLGGVIAWVSMKKDVSEALRLSRETTRRMNVVSVKVGALEARLEDIHSTVTDVRQNMLRKYSK